jgi:predicted acyl esterase
MSGKNKLSTTRSAAHVGIAGVAALLIGGAAAAADAQSPVSTEVATRIYGDNAHPVAYRKALPVDAPRARYTGFKPGKTVLKKGTIRRAGALPLPCDIIFERDVALKLRDGTTIYTDVFRPVKSGRYPSLVAWSPYGKEIGGQWLDDIEGRSGVPLQRVSELQKFEGPDPAFWVCNNYVVLNPDARGAYKSEGNITYWGRQLAEDGYDFIEWAAKQPWSSGNLGMAGNSWLAVSQWFIAAERPPHLKAIAPWEGFSDHFRETGNRGGIPAPQFPEMIIQTLAGNGLVEDQPKMIVDQQLMTPYWEDKMAKLDQINIPAYVVASYTNPAHTHGSFEGFRRIGTADKWLRVNNTNEWEDFYTPEYSNDLLKFFDRYLKGTKNGWEKTPRVRLSVLDPSGKDMVDRVENEWPLARTQFRQLHLANDGALHAEKAIAPSVVRYNVKEQGKTEFSYVFDKDTELTGYMKLRLWVEAQGADDMELAVSVQKLGTDGKPVLKLQGEGVVAPITATGLLRVSQRALDKSRSTESEPYLLNTREDKLTPGQVVPVDIGIWPMGMRYHAGEKLLLTVAAYRPMPNVDLGFGAAKVPVPTEKETFAVGEQVKLNVLGGKADTSPAFAVVQQIKPPPSRNMGTHVIHVGGQYDSYLLVPEVPTANK